MGFSDRLSSGWQVAKISMRVLREHKKLIIFPIISGICVLAVFASFITALMRGGVYSTEGLYEYDRGALLAFWFLFYLIAGFITVFVNMALMHCARLYFEGQEVSIGKGLSFSLSRITVILQWVLFSATVGTLLRMLQDRLSWIGKLLTAVAGVAWNVATFFVIPVLAYENVGPIDALKRSTDMVTKRWGEGLSGNVSLSAIMLLITLPVVVIGMGLSEWVSERAGISFIFGTMFLLMAISSALKNIFVSAIYHYLNTGSSNHLDASTVDGIFEQQ